MREPHIVPLSRQAVDLLRELHTHTGGRRLLFPNCRKLNECMTAKTLNRALEHMGFNGKESIGFSAHGFRATAFDNAERNGVSRRGHRTSVGVCREEQSASKL